MKELVLNSGSTKDLLKFLKTLKFHTGRVVSVLVQANGSCTVVTGKLEFSNPSKPIEVMTRNDFILVGEERIALKDIQDIDLTP